MKSIVRDLYKRFIIAGKRHPQGLSYVREKVKSAFMTNSALTEEVDIKRAVGKGRYMVRELNAFSQFHKYRMMRQRYGEGRESETNK